MGSEKQKQKSCGGNEQWRKCDPSWMSNHLYLFVNDASSPPLRLLKYSHHVSTLMFMNILTSSNSNERSTRKSLSKRPWPTITLHLKNLQVVLPPPQSRPYLLTH
jgi:hypothetical protein